MKNINKIIIVLIIVLMSICLLLINSGYQMYKEAIKEGTDEKYEAELDAIKADYASHIAAATGHLKSARECYERVNRKYLERIDYAELENVKDVILNKIFG